MPYALSLAPVMSRNDMEALGYIASASAEYDADHQAWRAFDGQYRSYWRNSSATGWIEQYFLSPVVVTSYSIIFSGESTSHPKNWTLKGSNDHSTWTTLDTQTNQTQTYTRGKYTYSFVNTAEYYYYRLDVSAVQAGGTFVSVNGLLLVGPDPAGDCIRIHSHDGGVYKDIVSDDTDGFSDLFYTDVKNDPGSLDFSLVGEAAYTSAITQEEGLYLIELWLSGQRVGHYLVDDVILDTSLCRVDVKCVGIAAYGMRSVITNSVASATAVTDSLFSTIIVAANADTVGYPLWYYDASKISDSVGSATWDWASAYCLDALKDIADQTRMRFYFDADMFLCVKDVGELWQPTAETIYVDSATITSSYRELINRVVCKGTSTWVVDDTLSQATFGVFAKVIEDSAITSAAKASAAASKVMNSDRMLSRTALVNHAVGLRAGMNPMIAVPSGAIVCSHEQFISQVAYTLGDICDDINVGTQPPSVSGVVVTKK